MPAGPATRAGERRHGASGLHGQVSSATSPCERSNFSQTLFGVFFSSDQPSRWSGRDTLIFRHDTGRQFWSGCISLHQATRISCPLDSSATICHCGACVFSLFHSTFFQKRVKRPYWSAHRGAPTRGLPSRGARSLTIRVPCAR